MIQKNWEISLKDFVKKKFWLFICQDLQGKNEITRGIFNIRGSNIDMR